MTQNNPTQTVSKDQDTTTHLKYRLPNLNHTLQTDVLRIKHSFEQIDEHVHALQTETQKLHTEQTQLQQTLTQQQQQSTQAQQQQHPIPSRPGHIVQEPSRVVAVTEQCAGARWRQRPCCDPGALPGLQ